MAGLDGEITIPSGNTLIELFALYAEVEGMKAENMQREVGGHSMAYDDSNFFAIADKMRALKEISDD